MNNENDTSRFTIQGEKDDTPDSIYVTEAENLRIEKLSTRITLVAVLIPCLLVIVLAVAYLDIKNRVASTQNPGSMGVQNLSKALDSRFSSLSLKQAKLEESLAEITKTLETANAALQVKVDKAVSQVKGEVEGKAERAGLADLKRKTENALGALKKDLADLNAAFTKFDEELADQLLLMADGLKKDQERLAAVEKKTQQLEAQKLSKESMDLALGLERLALQELVKDRIRDVEKKLARMNERIDSLDQRVKISAASRPRQSPKPAPPATSTAPATRPSSASPPSSSGIEEQTIN